MTPLTETQERVLLFIWDFVEREGYYPTFHQVSDGMGMRHKNSADTHIEALRKKGRLARPSTERRGSKKDAIRIVADVLGCPVRLQFVGESA